MDVFCLRFVGKDGIEISFYFHHWCPPIPKQGEFVQIKGNRYRVASDFVDWLLTENTDGQRYMIAKVEVLLMR